MTNELRTKKETAEPLRISIRSLDRLRSEGKIKSVKVRSAVRSPKPRLNGSSPRPRSRREQR